MSNMRYTVMCRYEHWTSHGKDWSNWFKYHTSRYYENLSDAEECMKKCVEGCKATYKIVKLNYEFKIEQIDIDMLPTLPPPTTPKPKKPRGRPKKNAEA